MVSTTPSWVHRLAALTLLGSATLGCESPPQPIVEPPPKLTEAGKTPIEAEAPTAATDLEIDEILQALTDPQAGAPLLQRFITANETLGNRRVRIANLERALGILGPHGDPVAQVDLLNNLGKEHRRLREYDVALDHCREALAIAKQHGYRDGEAIALNNIGVTLRNLGKPWPAIERLQEARTIWKGQGNALSESTALHNLGLTYSRIDRLADALLYLETALATLPETAAVDEPAPTLTEVSRIHLRQGDLPSALRFARQALDLRIRAGTPAGKAATLDALGTISWRQGDIAAALDAYREAREIYRQLADTGYEADVLANLGRLYESQGDVTQALEYSRLALDGFRAAGSLHGQAHALYISALAELRRSELATACELMEEVLEIIEAWRRGPDLGPEFFATRHVYYELYIEILMRLHERDPTAGFDELAFGASELGSARGLLGGLAEARSSLSGDVDPDLLRQRDRLIVEVNASQRDLEGLQRAQAPPTKLRARERDIQALLADWDSLQEAVKRSSPGYAGRSLPEILTLRQTQDRLLDEQTHLLAYSLGADRSFLWSVDSTSIRSYVLPGRAEIESLATSVYTLFSRSYMPDVEPQFRAAAAQLSDMLLGPVAPRLGHQRLMIIPDGALQYLPFGALPKPIATSAAPAWRAGVSDPKPLLVDHRVVYLPSASVVAWLDRQFADRPPAPQTLAVFADPVFDHRDQRASPEAQGGAAPATRLEAAATDLGLRGFDRLPFTRREANAILGLVPPESSFSALDFEATKDRLFATDLSRYRFIHIASHGILNPRHSELSGIVLSGVDPEGLPRDAFLRTFEVPGLELAADLVVLSACRTALGQDLRGESLLGLTRAFMTAGATRVLVSLWNVNDQATAQLMERFYRRMLREGSSPAAALRAAQLSMIEEGRWRAPYFWAGFLLQGKPS